MDIVERFLKYTSFETTSDDSSETVPSTKIQLELGKYLVEELKGLGLDNARIDDKGYVYAHLESNTDKDLAKIGFVAHMDTSPEMSGKNVKPRIVKYEGGDIKLNEKYTTKVSEFPFLNDLVGQELIVTDGNTLLGADDKAGIAIIVSAIEHLVKNPEIKHGDIKIGFTPDEEIGRGADHFDVEGFDADFAYTVDGGPLGELEYENFNAASAKISIEGKGVHPGSSKNIMINSQLLAMELHNMLPVNMRPEYTESYEGFYLLEGIKGSVSNTEMRYIIRDHDMEKFEAKKNLLIEIVEFLNKKYGDLINLEIKDSYYNMKKMIEPHMEIIELAKKSMEEVGIEPLISPIRGGTDGASLSYKGLPCPNIFTGGYNYHGRYELLPVESLKKGKELLLQIIKNLENFNFEK
ncbi:peptidase T [Peptoniphilus obesi]|uniref:peptidase T n=1 Tax=Peptoniphilus obesi TaxID=1472765 RepID=UPI0004B60BE2|nr:peptidase T [Peptoniphilus obesi]